MKTLEGLALRRLVQEIEKDLVGGRIQRVTFPREEEVSIEIFTTSGPRELLVFCHPELSALTLLPSSEKGQPPRSAWQKLLNKYLVGGKIVSLEQVGWDRVVCLVIDNPNLWERETQFLLFIELTGRNTNLILTRNDLQKTILGALRQVTPHENRFRSILPSLPYTLPPQKAKLNPLSSLHPDFFPKKGKDFTKWCIEHLDGFGPFAADFFSSLLQEGEDPVEALQRVLRPLLSPECCFFVFLSDDGRPLGVFWEKIPSFAFAHAYEFRSLNEAMAFLILALRDYFTEEASRKKRERKTREDIEFLTEAIHKIEALIPREEDIAMVRLRGELLKVFPQLEVVEKSEEGVLVRNSLSSSPKEVFIPLHASLSLSENMQAYFREYRRLKTRREKLLRKKQELEEKLARIRIDNESLEEIRRGSSQPLGSPVGIARFLTPSGNEIWMGKNAKANRLLVRLASRNDYWFHSRNFPGAHVLLKVFHPETFEEDVQRAARLAAYFSSGRLESRVEVVSTQVKYLRPVGGREEGKILYRKEETLIVDPSLPQDLTTISPQSDSR
jgi:predicted ribosome quality control (RQC) complex YloA/Tae2 family protein